MELWAEWAEDAVVNICYAQCISRPLDITIQSNKHINPYTNFFETDKLVAEVNNEWQDYDLLKLGTFYNDNIEVNKSDVFKERWGIMKAIFHWGILCEVLT